MIAIGLMSGTSLDGVDAAVVETDGEVVTRTGKTAALMFEDGLRLRLRRLLAAAAGLAPDDPEVIAVGRIVADRHAEAVAMLACRAEIVGFHGQTILHDPARGRSWQIGDAALLAHKVRLPVAFDFRGADVAAGGEGAPLAPLFHAAMAADLAKPLLVVNIGGVANITFLGADGTVLACDTGPGNGPLDDWVRLHTGAAFDRDGALAAAGVVDQVRLARLMADGYFGRPAPKSLDRLHFSALVEAVTAGLSPADGAATLAAFTAASIAAAPLPQVPLRVLVAGGGRHNRAIMRALQTWFKVPVAPVETVGWEGDALEAQCFGFLAVRTLRGLPLSLPTTTGVAAPMPGG
ncbi:anhydro-N-acetylmuramic acid kinase, partial [Acidiphilium sp.]|uniref:anhydro-N-acetylmuramic acid kinase n=1 Tax=Acidiphilium sp. TaxID=527 RepID=UPI003D08431B